MKERERIMKKLWTVLCAGLLLMTSACSSGNGSSSGNNGTTTPSNELTVAIDGQVTTLDPGYSTETVNAYILAHTTASLFSKDEAGNTTNELCKDYTVSEDGLTYTFNLRENVKWSDGVAMTANDFKYGLQRNLTYGTDNSWAVFFLTYYLEGAADYAYDATVDPTTLDIPGVQVIDDNTLQLKLVRPCAYFDALVTNFVWTPLRADIADAHSSAWALKAGYLTLGAYKVVECNENEKVVIEKNPTYYNADEVSIEKITFMVMPDIDARSLAFKNNEVDVAMNISATTAQSHSNQEEVWKKPEVSNYFLAINSGATGPEHMQNVDVRRALAIAIDKDALAAGVGGAGYYSPLNGYIPNGLKGVSEDFRDEQDAKKKFLEYNPEEAKALLAKAGYSEANPLKITYKYSDSQLHSDVAQILEQMWKAVGVQCTLQVVESGVFYSQLDQGDFEISRYGYSASDDPSQFLNLWTTGQQVTPAVDDPAFDKMIDDVGFITDRTEYMNKLHEIEEYFVEEKVYTIPLFNYSTPVLLKTNIKNVQLRGTTPFYGSVTFE